MITEELAKIVSENLNHQPTNYFSGSWNAHPILPQNILVMPRGDAFVPSKRNQIHHRFLLAVNFKGRGQIHLDAGIVDFFPEHCRLIFPYQNHSFAYERPFSWVFITFEYSPADKLEILRDRDFSVGEDFLELLKFLLLYDLRQGFSKRTPETLTHLTGLLLHTLLVRSTESPQENPQVHQPPGDLQSRVLKFVQEHIHQQVSPAQIAAEFGYSESHFRALFHQETHVSLMLFVRQIRLRHALALLISSRRKVSDVARKTGFDSIYAFSQAFKKFFGVPPSAYRAISPTCKEKLIHPKAKPEEPTSPAPTRN